MSTSAASRSACEASRCQWVIQIREQTMGESAASFRRPSLHVALMSLGMHNLEHKVHSHVQTRVYPTQPGFMQVCNV
jgi:hypothetical protein